jgi:hypothetical protein
MQSKSGKWIATFTDVPACDDSGKLTVESRAVKGTETSTDCRDHLSIFDLNAPREYGPRSLLVHLGTPAAGASVTNPFPASGTLDGTPLTGFQDCFFSCPDNPDVEIRAAVEDHGMTQWHGEFQQVPPCTDGTVTVYGDDGSSDSHGNITVT